MGLIFCAQFLIYIQVNNIPWGLHSFSRLPTHIIVSGGLGLVDACECNQEILAQWNPLLLS